MCDANRADSKEPAGAPKDEIEITPEMVKAGTHEFCAFDSRFEDVSSVVTKIFIAMNHAKHEVSAGVPA